jgi:hypothetical protein
VVDPDTPALSFILRISENQLNEISSTWNQGCISLQVFLRHPKGSYYPLRISSPGTAIENPAARPKIEEILHISDGIRASRSMVGASQIMDLV